jgi:hypothetical protein
MSGSGSGSGRTGKQADGEAADGERSPQKSNPGRAPSKPELRLPKTAPRR